VGLTGAHVNEDRGAWFGRTKQWPAIPQDLYNGSPPCSSTTVVCSECGSPWGGLMFDHDLGTFRHRETWKCH